MAHFLGKALNIRSDEWPRLSLLFLMAFLVVAGNTWGRTIVFAAFLQQVGVQALPAVLAISAIFSIISTAVYTAFADRVSNDKLLIAILAVAVGSMAIGRFMLGNQLATLAYPLLYFIFLVVIQGMFFLHWWTYVNGYYDTRSAKRIIPIVATAARIAGIVGGLTMPLLNRALAPENIIVVWIGTLALCGVLTWAMPHILREDKTAESQPLGLPPAAAETSPSTYIQNLREGFQFVSQSAYLRWMALATFLLMMLMSFLHFQSSEIFEMEMASVEELSNLVGNLTGFANLIMLPFQLFLLGRIIGRVGLGNANLIFPTVTLVIAGFLVLDPSVPSALMADLDYNILRSSVHNPIDSLLYNAVPLRIKGRARAFISGWVLPIGSLLGSSMLLLPFVLASDWFVPAMIALLAVAFVITGVIISRQYGRALISLLEQEDFSFLLAQEASDIVVTDPATLRSLEQKLEESQSQEFTIFMAKLISDIGGSAAVPILDRAARQQEDARVRATIVDVLVAADIRDAAIRRLYTDLLDDPAPDVRRSAVQGLMLVEGEGGRFLQLSLEKLTDPDIDVRALLLPGLLQSKNPNYYTPARQGLDEILTSTNPQERIRGVRVLGTVGDKDAIHLLAQFLQDPNDAVRLEAATSIESLSQGKLPPDVAPAIIENITLHYQDPIERVRQLTLLVLGRIGSHESFNTLVKGLSDPSPQVRATAVEVLAQAGKAIIPIVHPQLDAPDSQLRKMAVMILSRVNRREYGPLITSHITGNLLTIYRNLGRLKALATCNKYASISILEDTHKEQNQQLTAEIFYLLTALHDPAAIEIIAQSLHSDDERVQANALEALESLTTSQTAMLIGPLFENNNGSESFYERALALSQEVWDMQHPQTADLLVSFLKDEHDPWHQALATFALGEIGAPAWVAEQVTADPQPEPPPPQEEPDDFLGGFKARRKKREERKVDGDQSDLLGALMEEPEAKEESTKSAELPKRPHLPNPFDLIKEDEETSEKAPDISETIIGRSPFADALPSISGGAADETAEQDPCQSLFPLWKVETLVADSLLHTHPDVRIAAQAANRLLSGQRLSDWAKENAVLSTIEKIIFLKEVPFFEGMTVDQLKVLAQVCEEAFFAEDTRIYNQDDPGGVLYVVVSGRVGIEREGRRKGSYARVGTVEAHSYFGEMNLFDNSPRESSALAIQDTLTLRLRREPLIALARQYPELSLELINVLSQRLRETTGQIANLTRSRPSELHKLFDQFDE
jgi:HEAT repeat protein/CRP-like cAMP-binding protein/ATP/ADP translocase